MGGTVADWVGHAIAAVCLILLFVDRWTKKGKVEGTSTTTVARLADRVTDLEREASEHRRSEVDEAREDGALGERVRTLKVEVDRLRKNVHKQVSLITAVQAVVGRISGVKFKSVSVNEDDDDEEPSSG